MPPSLFLAVCLTAAPAVAQQRPDAEEPQTEAPQTGGPAQAPSRPTRPKQTFLGREDEDWRVLRDLGGSETLDTIRDIRVGERGSLTFGGTVRLRYENFQDFGAGTRDDGYLLSHLRLHANYRVSDDLRFFAEGMSALATDRDLPGGRRPLDVNELELHQAFVEYTWADDAGGDLRVRLRAGRQALQFGNQRLVSPLPWVNSLRHWDGARVDAFLGDWQVTPFFTLYAPPRKYDFDSADDDQLFWGVYSTGAVGDRMVADLYFLALNDDNQNAFNGTAGTDDRYTVGGRLELLPRGGGGLDAEVEGALQTGSVGSADVAAAFVDTEFGWTLPDMPLAPRLFAGGGVATGDHNPGGDVQTFNQLFPLGHAWLGFADQIGRQNIIEARLGKQLQLAERTQLRLAGHAFWRHSDNDDLYNAGGGVIRADTGTDARYVGTEVDLTVTHKIDAGITFEAGYSHLFAGTFFERTGTANDLDFFYLQAIYLF